MEHHPERRRAPRYLAALPLAFEAGHGVTHDVSVAGARFQTSTRLAVGGELTVTLEGFGFDAVGVQARCLARVVRVEPGVPEGTWHVAVAFERVDLEAARLDSMGSADLLYN